LATALQDGEVVGAECEKRFEQRRVLAAILDADDVRVSREACDGVGGEGDVGVLRDVVEQQRHR